MTNNKWKACMAAVVAAMLYIGCDNTIKTDPINVVYTGAVPVEFNWTDARIDCPECVYTYVTVETPNHGNFDYGPIAFAFDGVPLPEVLGGADRSFVVWMVDVGGNVIYRGVADGVRVYSGILNAPVTVDLYPLDWYLLNVTQPSADWALYDVKMSADGAGWIAGADFAGGDGVVYHAGDNTWTLNNSPVIAATQWELSSIAASGTNAWAVGLTYAGASPWNNGLILRNDGALWNDDVAEPAFAGDWALAGIDFDSNGIGWAVGSESGTGGIVLNYDAGWTTFSAPAALPNYVLNDVAAVTGGEFVAGGYDSSTMDPVVIRWNDLASAYDVFNPLFADIPACATAWGFINDVYAISATEWWAAGGCYDSGTGAPIVGLIYHYAANTLTRETLSNPGVAYVIEGISADAAGDAWAVGNSATAPIIFRKDGGTWSHSTPAGGSASWRLNAVSFPATGWGYAVGQDVTNSRGVILRYGFPR